MKARYEEEVLQQNKEPLIDELCEREDWSTVHRNTGSLGQQPNSPQKWAQFKFSQEQIDQYKRDGYIAPMKILTDEECDLLLKDYEKLIKGDPHPLFYEYHKNQTGDSNNVLMHALGHWRITRLFHDLIYHPSVCVPASQLITGNDREARVRFWHDQLFAKPPKDGGCVAWHQDYSYWTRTQPMQHLTIHIALDEQTIENGCIHYIPQSHNWTRNGKPLPVTDYDFKDMESIKTILTPEEKIRFKPAPCCLKKGEASFHHPLTVHGSFPNRSNFPRRAAVINYIADGVISNSNELLLKGTYVIPKNEPVKGQFYPLIYDPAWAI